MPLHAHKDTYIDLSLRLCSLFRPHHRSTYPLRQQTSPTLTSRPLTTPEITVRRPTSPYFSRNLITFVCGPSTAGCEDLHERKAIVGFGRVHIFVDWSWGGAKKDWCGVRPVRDGFTAEGTESGRFDVRSRRKLSNLSTLMVK